MILPESLEEAVNIRKQMEITQFEIATTCGVGQDRVSCWEKGVNKISLEDFETYLGVLGYRLSLEKLTSNGC